MNDLLLAPSPNGLDIVIENGIVVLTSGLENAVYLSLFTSDYWGNALDQAADRYTSRIPQIIATGVLTNESRKDVVTEAEQALAWMVSSHVADRVIVRGQIPATSTLHLGITIYEPQRVAGQQFDYAINWDAQRVTLLEAA